MRLLPLACFISSAFISTSSFAAPKDLAEAINTDYQKHLEPLFKHFHQNPELSFMEFKTAERLAKELKAAGFEVTTGAVSYTHLTLPTILLV